jgi:hypothetical protein
MMTTTPALSKFPASFGSSQLAGGEFTNSESGIAGNAPLFTPYEAYTRPHVEIVRPRWRWWWCRPMPPGLNRSRASDWPAMATMWPTVTALVVETILAASWFGRMSMR